MVPIIISLMVEHDITTAYMVDKFIRVKTLQGIIDFCNSINWYNMFCFFNCVVCWNIHLMSFIVCFLPVKEVQNEREHHLMWINKFSYFPVQAVKKNIPILMDAEKLRDGLDDLLKLADYVVCAAQFPQVCALVPLELNIQ